MKDEVKTIINSLIGIVIGFCICYFLSDGTVKSRGTISELRESITRSKSIINEFELRSDRIRQITSELEESTNTTIRTVRDCLETVEKIRYYVYSLEVELGIVDPDSIYDRIDSWLKDELGDEHGHTE